VYVAPAGQQQTTLCPWTVTMSLFRKCVLLGAAISAAASAACGSSSGPSSTQCSSGTVAKDGVCAAPDGSMAESSVDAATDASTDGQVPADGGADTASTADAAVDVATDAWTDDPCPEAGTFRVHLNCSTSCPLPESCSSESCAQSGTTLEINNWGDLPVLIRTPSHPGVDPACPRGCGVTEDYGLTVVANLPVATPAKELMLTVGAPWHVASWSGPAGGPFCPFGDAGCSVFPSTGVAIGVWTDDPNAPARNALVTAVPTGTTCP